MIAISEPKRPRIKERKAIPLRQLQPVPTSQHVSPHLRRLGRHICTPNFTNNLSSRDSCSTDTVIKSQRFIVSSAVIVVRMALSIKGK